MSFIRSNAFRNKAINCQGLMFYSSSAGVARSPTTIRVVSGSLSQISSGPASPSFSPVYDVSIKIMDGSSPDENITAEANIIKILTSSVGGRTLDNDNQLRDLLVKAINGESSGSFIVFPSSGNGSNGIQGIEAFSGNSVFKNDSVSRQKTISLQAEVAGKDAELHYRFYNSDGLGIVQFNTLEHGFNRISQRQFDALSGKPMKKGSISRTLDSSFVTGSFNTDYLSDMRQGIDIRSFDGLFDSLFAKARSNTSLAIARDGKLPDKTKFDENRQVFLSSDTEYSKSSCIVSIGWAFAMRYHDFNPHPSPETFVEKFESFRNRRIATEAWRIRNYWHNKRMRLTDGHGNVRVFRFLAGPFDSREEFPNISSGAEILNMINPQLQRESGDVIPDTGEIVINLGYSKEWWDSGAGYDIIFNDQEEGIFPRTGTPEISPAIPRGIPDYSHGADSFSLKKANPTLPDFEFICNQIVTAVRSEYNRGKNNYADFNTFSINAKLKKAKLDSFRMGIKVNVFGDSSSSGPIVENNKLFGTDVYHYVLLEHDPGGHGNSAIIEFLADAPGENDVDGLVALETQSIDRHNATETDISLKYESGRIRVKKSGIHPFVRNYKDSHDLAFKIITGKKIGPVNSYFLSNTTGTPYSQDASFAYSSWQYIASRGHRGAAMDRVLGPEDPDTGQRSGGYLPMRFEGSRQDHATSSLIPMVKSNNPVEATMQGSGRTTSAFTHALEQRDLGMPDMFSDGTPFNDREDIATHRYSLDHTTTVTGMPGYYQTTHRMNGPLASKKRKIAAFKKNAMLNDLRGTAGGFVGSWASHVGHGGALGGLTFGPYWHAKRNVDSVFTIKIPVDAGGTGRTVTIRLKKSLSGVSPSADTISIRIGALGSNNPASAAISRLIQSAINGNPVSAAIGPVDMGRIQFASSGDGLAGSGIKGLIATPGEDTTEMRTRYPGFPNPVRILAINASVSLKLSKPGPGGNKRLEFTNVSGWAPFQGFPVGEPSDDPQRYRLTGSQQLAGGQTFDEFHPGAYIIRANDPAFVLTRSEDGSSFMKRGPGITDPQLPDFLADYNSLSTPSGVIDVFDQRAQIERNSIEGPFFARGVKGSLGQYEDHYKRSREISFGYDIKSEPKTDFFLDIGHHYASSIFAADVIDTAVGPENIEGERHREQRIRFYVPEELGGLGRSVKVALHTDQRLRTSSFGYPQGFTPDPDTIYVYDKILRQESVTQHTNISGYYHNRCDMLIRAINGEDSKWIIYPEDFKGIPGIRATKGSDHGLFQATYLGQSKEWPSGSLISLEADKWSINYSGRPILVEPLNNFISIRKKRNPDWPSFKMGEYSKRHGLENMERDVQTDDLGTISPFSDIRHGLEKIYNESFLDKKLLSVIANYSGTMGTAPDGTVIMLNHDPRAYVPAEEGDRQLSLIPVLPLFEKKEHLSFSDIQSRDKICLTGYQYENNSIGLDSIAFGGLLK